MLMKRYQEAGPWENRYSKKNVFGPTLPDIISDPGDQNGRIKFLPSKYAGIRKTGGMENNKNGLLDSPESHH